MDSRRIYDLTRDLKVWREQTQLTVNQDELFNEIIERITLLYEVLP